MQKIIRVGIAVLVMKGDKVLFGQRKNAHGEGLWAPPGGHLEFGESFEDCAKREVEEEVGLAIKNTHVVAVTNDFFQEKEKHYISVIVQADYDFGVVQVKEPDKCAGWHWFSWQDLPSPLFPSIEKLTKMKFKPSSANHEYAHALVNEFDVDELG